MRRKLTHDEQVAAIAKVNPNIEILGEITGNKVPVLCSCKVCHHEWEARPYNLKSGRGCPECKKVKTGNAKRLTHAEHVAAIKKVNPNVEILEEIKSVKKKVLCRCTICHYEWRVAPDYLKHGHGCWACAGSIKLSHKDHVEAIAKANPNVEVLGKIINSRTKVLCLCKVCGHKWDAKPSHLKSGIGCPQCSKTGFLSHKTGKLYVMVDDLNAPTMMKIGVSVREDKRSKNVLNSAHKAGVTIPALYVVKTWEGPTDLMQRIESMMHENYAEWNVRFPTKFDGYKEFFYYTPETAEVFDIIEETYHEIINANQAA